MRSHLFIKQFLNKNPALTWTMMRWDLTHALVRSHLAETWTYHINMPVWGWYENISHINTPAQVGFQNTNSVMCNLAEAILNQPAWWDLSHVNVELETSHLAKIEPTWAHMKRPKVMLICKTYEWWKTNSQSHSHLIISYGP